MSSFNPVSAAGSTALAIAPMTGPAAPFVAVGGILANLFGKLFGPPKTNVQTFVERVLPYTIGEAKLKGIPVFVFWFGDIVVTYPDGSYGVTSHTDTLQAAYDYWTQLGQTDVFEVLECVHGIEDYETGGCHYTMYGSMSMLSSATVSSVVNAVKQNPILWIGILIVGFFILRRFL